MAIRFLTREDFPPAELTHLLARTELFTDGQVYRILKIGGAQEGCVLPGPEAWPAPFWACMRDKDEVTLLLAQESLARLPAAVAVVDVSPPYRLITFDIPLDWRVVGYLAALTAVLAAAGISVFALSAFSRDHIFVAEVDFDRAWGVLGAFIRTCQMPVVDVAVDGESV